MLLGAFDGATLEQMVRIELDVNLEQVAGGKNLTERVHNLVAWAEQKDLIVALVYGALRQNPNNANLQKLASDVKMWVTPVNIGGIPPYKGLAFYDVDDANSFFGRRQLTTELVEFLRIERFLAVIGASGSGKSSLLRAGVVAAIRRGELPDSDQWLVRIVTPGARPLESISLAMMLPSDGEDDTAKFMRALRGESDALHLRARRLLDVSRRSHLLLVFDQFEEIFTQCQDALDRKAAIANIVAAAAADGVTSVVIALRADLYHRCAEYEELRRLLESNQRYIGAMSGDELREAIVEPAEQGGWSFEPGLVERILEDAEAEPGALPLFSFALLKTWEARNGTTLTFAGYLGAGGVQKALAKSADKFYGALNGDQQAMVKYIMLQLVQVDENDHEARRRVPLHDLTHNPEGIGNVGWVLEQLQRERLVTTINAPTSGLDPQSSINTSAIYVDVTHEALIREWGTLRQWLSENRTVLLFRDRIDDAYRQWTDYQEDSSALLRGRFLLTALEWQQSNPELVTPQQARFLALSDARRSAEGKAQTRRTVIGTILASSIFFLLIPALYFASQVAMYHLRLGSDWQPTDFPFNSVLSMAVAPSASDPEAPIICVGTSDIGVGCSSDLKAWNVYQSGLPQRRPESLNTRNTLLGSMWGSTWATKVVGVTALAFDQTDPMRLYAATFDSDHIFASLDAGVHWQALGGARNNDGDTGGTLPPLAGSVIRLAAHGDNLFVMTADTTAIAEGTRGTLYWSQNRGETWDAIGGPTTVTGVLRDFVLMKRANGELSDIVAVGKEGLFWMPHDAMHTWRAIALPVGNFAGLLISNTSSHVYLVGFSTQQEQGVLYRWVPGSDMQPELVWQFAQRPLALTVQSLEGTDEMAWLLFLDGSVTSIDSSGQTIDHESRPGWPLSSAKTIRVLPDADRIPLVLMAHSDGLLQLCEYEDHTKCGLD